MFFFHKDYWFQLLHDQICNYVIISAQNVLQRVHKGSFIILYLADRRYDDITLGLSSNCKTSSLSLFVICRSEQYRKVTPQEVVKQQCGAPSVGSVCRQDFIALACGGVSEIMIVRERSESDPPEKHLSTFPLLFASRDRRLEGDSPGGSYKGTFLDIDVFAPLLRDKIKSAAHRRRGTPGSWLECLAWPHCFQQQFFFRILILIEALFCVFSKCKTLDVSCTWFNYDLFPWRQYCLVAARGKRRCYINYSARCRRTPRRDKHNCIFPERLDL